MARFIISLVLCFGLSSPVMADVEKARHLFVQGEYQDALLENEGDESPAALTLQAEILSGMVMLGLVDTPNKTSKRARKLAYDAHQANPVSQEAFLQYVLAYGFETRTSSPIKAWRKKLPQKTLALIQSYQAAYPDDPRGEALLGAWHLGIVRKTGDKRAKKWFDASETEGITAYRSAHSAAPNDIVIGSNFGVTLLSVNLDKYYDQAISMLEAIMQIPARTGIERDVQDRVRLVLLHKNNRSDLAKAVDDLLDGTLVDEDEE